MRFASLGSGSRGNALVVEAGRTRVLLDCGFSLRATEARLNRLGLGAADLSGVLVTHEHSDHLAGVVRLAKKHRLPVWLTRGTAVALAADVRQEVDIRFLDSHEPMAVGDLQIQPYPVPHDAREPVQFTFADGARKLGVLTDAGSITAHMLEVLAGCAGLVLECNHDPELLAASRYPTFLKQRVGGRYGHLANATAASLLAQLQQEKLQHVVAAHLSQENNRPSLATAALAGAMNCDPGWIGVADQEAGFDWRHLA
ncbi:MAG: MBL fold metallo-hydrolase [Betaproteobacteria bacterium]|nr:MBL fold metallo-hydrolase [Betaproteobacteria bacterium]